MSSLLSREFPWVGWDFTNLKRFWRKWKIRQRATQINLSGWKHFTGSFSKQPLFGCSTFEEALIGWPNGFVHTEDGANILSTLWRWANSSETHKTNFEKRSREKRKEFDLAFNVHFQSSIIDSVKSQNQLPLYSIKLKIFQMRVWYIKPSFEIYLVL